QAHSTFSRAQAAAQFRQLFFLQSQARRNESNQVAAPRTPRIDGSDCGSKRAEVVLRGSEERGARDWRILMREFFEPVAPPPCQLLAFQVDGLLGDLVKRS